MGVLAGLLTHNAPLRCVVIAGPPPTQPARGKLDLPVAPPNSLATLARSAGVAVHYTGESTDRAIGAALSTLHPERVVVACLAAKLSAQTLSQARDGMWNIHPSSLPFNRGPSPMFWQLRAGATVAGVSVHCMDTRLDTGQLVTRRPVPLPSGVNELEAEHLAGLAGGTAIAPLLDRTSKTLAFTPQSRQRGSYQTEPDDESFRLHPHWSIEHVWNFMRGVSWRRRWFRIATLTGEIRAREAIRVMPGRTLDGPRRLGGTVELPFANGVVVVQI
jgi:methionyl-tRNA formyltransferase